VPSPSAAHSARQAAYSCRCHFKAAGFFCGAWGSGAESETRKISLSKRDNQQAAEKVSRRRPFQTKSGTSSRHGLDGPGQRRGHAGQLPHGGRVPKVHGQRPPRRWRVNAMRFLIRPDIRGDDHSPRKFPALDSAKPLFQQPVRRDVVRARDLAAVLAPIRLSAFARHKGFSGLTDGSDRQTFLQGKRWEFGAAPPDRYSRNIPGAGLREWVILGSRPLGKGRGLDCAWLGRCDVHGIFGRCLGGAASPPNSGWAKPGGGLGLGRSCGLGHLNCLG
jgi:hypothetical protein